MGCWSIRFGRLPRTGLSGDFPVLVSRLFREVRYSLLSESRRRPQPHAGEGRRLRTYATALQANPNIRVFANQNDFLLPDTDLKWLQATFPTNQLTVYEHGGHLGNLASPEVQKAIVGALENLRPPNDDMAQPTTTAQSWVGQLCPACGLCCNGVLFADVELRAGDNPSRLRLWAWSSRPKAKSSRSPSPAIVLMANGAAPIRNGHPLSQLRVWHLEACAVGELSAAAGLKRISEVQDQIHELRNCSAGWRLRQASALSRRYAKSWRNRSIWPAIQMSRTAERD